MAFCQKHGIDKKITCHRCSHQECYLCMIERAGGENPYGCNVCKRGIILSEFANTISPEFVYEVIIPRLQEVAADKVEYVKRKISEYNTIKEDNRAIRKRLSEIRYAIKTNDRELDRLYLSKNTTTYREYLLAVDRYRDDLCVICGYRYHTGIHALANNIIYKHDYLLDPCKIEIQRHRLCNLCSRSKTSIYADISFRVDEYMTGLPTNLVCYVLSKLDKLQVPEPIKEVIFAIARRRSIEYRFHDLVPLDVDKPCSEFEYNMVKTVCIMTSYFDAYYKIMPDENQLDIRLDLIGTADAVKKFLELEPIRVRHLKLLDKLHLGGRIHDIDGRSISYYPKYCVDPSKPQSYSYGAYRGCLFDRIVHNAKAASIHTLEDVERAREVINSINVLREHPPDDEVRHFIDILGHLTPPGELDRLRRYVIRMCEDNSDEDLSLYKDFTDPPSSMVKKEKKLVAPVEESITSMKAIMKQYRSEHKELRKKIKPLPPHPYNLIDSVDPWRTNISMLAREGRGSTIRYTNIRLYYPYTYLHKNGIILMRKLARDLREGYDDMGYTIYDAHMKDLLIDEVMKICERIQTTIRNTDIYVRTALVSSSIYSTRTMLDLRKEMKKLVGCIDKIYGVRIGVPISADSDDAIAEVML